MFSNKNSLMEESGYNPITTFWSDFSIADAFGVSAIKDTYKRGFEYAKTNYKVLTEFVMVLNHKIWQHYERGNKIIARLYDSLWTEADHFAFTTLTGEAARYYAHTLD